MWLILVKCSTKTCVLVFVLLSLFLLSFISLDISAQNETTESVSEGIPSTNDTELANVNNGSTPILFEVASQFEGGDTAPNQSSFKAQIAWIPNAIGSENTFSIKFLNTSSGEELQNVTYDIMLFNEESHLSESHRSNQQAASQKYVFPEPGLYTLKIDNIGNTTAEINLPIQVVPEFAGAGPATAILAGLLILILLLVRFKTHRLGLSVR
jgi:hypothetical protein